jgi:hypothetical protein
MLTPTGEARMAMGRREKDIKLLVAKFVKLVESLNPGERLSIKKVTAGKRGSAPKAATKPATKSSTKPASKTTKRR